MSAGASAVQLELAHAEAVRPNMRVNLGEAPLDGCMKELSLLAREGRNSPATGSTGFAYKRFGHICLPLVSTVACSNVGKP
jgi:hypothetical protein